MKDIIILMRPHQWLKNLFVLLPLFFDRRLADAACWPPCAAAFLAFCLASSAVYCLNDILDAEADRLHPVKRSRPVASGRVPKARAAAAAVSCAALSLAAACAAPGGAACAAALYLAANAAYCVRLKQVALLDVFIIAAGFVLRLLAGGAAAGVDLSHWIVLMTFLLALFLAFAKRRDDVALYEGTGVKARKNVSRYNLQFLNQAISITASVTMVCYIMYTVSDDAVARMRTPRLYATSVFVLAGIMRYLQLAVVDMKSGSPTKVLMRDRFIQLCVAGWAAAFFIILYF